MLAIGRSTLLDLDRPLTFYYVDARLRWCRLRAARAAAAARASATRSPASRRNEQRMRAAGFSTYPYKLAAFVLAGALAGVAGFLWR